MTKGIIFGALLVSAVIAAKAQETTSSSNGHHQLGIRISSKDALVNHFISYKYYFNRTIAEAPSLIAILWLLACWLRSIPR